MVDLARFFDDSLVRRVDDDLRLVIADNGADYPGSQCTVRFPAPMEKSRS